MTENDRIWEKKWLIEIRYGKGQRNRRVTEWKSDVMEETEKGRVTLTPI